MAKPNYHHARKQKELARKARQQEKQQRRSARPGARGEIVETTPSDTAPTQSDPTSGGTSGSGG